METNKEYLQTKYAPGREFEVLAVAFAMNYMQHNPGAKSLCDMADIFRISPEGLNDLIEQSKGSRLLSGQRPNRLEQLASVNGARYANFLKCVNNLNRVVVQSNPAVSVNTTELALARHYLNSHNNATYRSQVAQSLGVDVSTLEQLFYAAATKELFRNQNKALLDKFAEENADRYTELLDRLSDIKYVKSDIDPGKKAEDLIVGFAVNYIQHHPDDITKAKVFSLLKMSPAVLAELYRKAQKRPVLKGYTVPTLGKLAQQNWKRYQTFVKKVENVDLKVQVDAGDIIERMIPSRELGAAVYLINKGELSADQICQVWGLSREGFDNAMDKFTGSEEFLENYVDDAGRREKYIERISPEVEELRDAAAEILNPAYKMSGEQGQQNINTVTQEERENYLRYHPDVFAGLDNEHLTYHNAMVACQSCGLALEHVMKRAPRLVDYQLCMAAVKSNGYALKWVKRAWRDKKMCFTAVSSDYNAYKFVPRNMKGIRKLLHLAVTPLGGGHNIRFMFEKDKSKYLCHMADRTFAEAREYFPRKFAPSDNELKRIEKMERANMLSVGKADSIVIKVTPQDYFDLYPTLVKEARETIEKNFSAVKAETEKFVRCIADFYNGAISASQILAEQPMAGRYPQDMDVESKYRAVVMDTYACAARHPELVPSGWLNINFKPVVKRDLSAVSIDDYFNKLIAPEERAEGNASTKSMAMPGYMSDEVKQGVVHLLRQEAELALAYRNGEISGEKFLSTLPVGDKVPKLEASELSACADRLSQYWADRFPDMIIGQKQEKVEHREQQRSTVIHR